MSQKKLKGQVKVFKELEKQLLTQADRLGIREDYTPLAFKELAAEALKNHLIAFYQERSNLEYEMQMVGTDKKESLIKLERLWSYIKRAERLGEQLEKDVAKIIDKNTADGEKAKKAAQALKPQLAEVK